MGKSVEKSFDGENLQQRTKLTYGDKKKYPGGCLSLPRAAIYMYITINLYIFSETAWPSNAKFHVQPPCEEGKVYINGPGHMIKMAAIPIYGIVL